MKRSRAIPAYQKKPDGPETNVGHLCFLISKEMRTVLDRGLAEFDLRAQQAAVLLQCCRQHGASPSYLASTVGTDTAGITGLLDQLEKRDLVIRRTNPSDRRAAVVEPTQKGRALLPRIGRVFRTLQAQSLAGFPKEDASRLEDLLQRLRHNVQEQLKESSAE
jgi:DNA-binding MarR family transcriptional regulator